MANRARLEQLARQAARRYGVPEAGFLALIGRESGWDPSARSPVGAQGIAQFMPGTARGLGINPLDPAQALPAAAKHLATLKKNLGSWKLALAGYNAGAGAVQRYGGVPPYRETQNYVAALLPSFQSSPAPTATPTAPAAPAPTRLEVNRQGVPTRAGGLDLGAVLREFNRAAKNVQQGIAPGDDYVARVLGLVQQAKVNTGAGRTGESVARTGRDLPARVTTPTTTPPPAPSGQYGTPWGTTFALPGLGGVPAVPGTSTIKTPKGQSLAVTTFDGKPVSAWWASILRFARSKGWKGGVNSGYRSIEEQQRIWARNPNPKWVARPGSSPHQYGMAVDISDGPGFERIVRQYGLPVWRYAAEGWHFEPAGFRTNGTELRLPGSRAR